MISIDHDKTVEFLHLDPDDPFDQLLIPIVEMNRKKRADYTHGGNIYSNFEEVAEATGLTPLEVVDVMVAVKNARIKALKINAKGPQNESVEDSYLDRAVYSILALGIAKTSAQETV